MKYNRMPWDLRSDPGTEKGHSWNPTQGCHL